MQRYLILLILAIVTVFLSVPRYSYAHHSTFAFGDVFVAVGDGNVQWYHANGILNQTLQTGSGGFTTGMAFDVGSNLYVTNFSAGNVSKFAPNGALIGIFGNGYSGHPESILFNIAGDVYVGAVDGDNDIRKFDMQGNFIAQYNVATEDRGSDWIDLAVDQCTMFYTSEERNIKRFNVCNNSQLPDFNVQPLPSTSYALRLLRTGGLLVANTSSIIRLNASGSIIQSYDAPSQDCWFALNLDPDGSSFWSADFCSSSVFKFDIETGAQLLSFNTGTGDSTVFGLAVLGEISQSNPIQPPTVPVVAVDAGHGTTSTGQHVERPTPSSTYGLFEADLNQAIAFHVRASLLDDPPPVRFQVWMPRTDKFNVPLMQRIHDANRLRVNVYVSVHNNAGGPTANGTEVLYNSKHANASSSLRLANSILTKQVALGLRNRHVIDRCCPPVNGSFIPAQVRYTNMPAVVTEIAFFTNSQRASGQTVTDEELLNDLDFRRQAGEAISEGVEEFFQ